MEAKNMELKGMIRSIEDFPAKGIIFRDITTALKDPKGLALAVDEMEEQLKGIEFDVIIGPESRGFIFGVPLAYNFKKGFVPARKTGKLPAETVSKAYELEYGTTEIEVHKDAITPGLKVVIVDDLLATGGTAKAVAEMVTELGAEVVGMAFLIELSFLDGRTNLAEYPNVKSVLEY